MESVGASGADRGGAAHVRTTARQASGGVRVDRQQLLVCFPCGPSVC